MCYHRSYIVTKDHKVLSSISDHHIEIRLENRIPEITFHSAVEHVAVECNPTPYPFI